MSLSYELCKQLKEAGFPQKRYNAYIPNELSQVGTYTCYIPTLSDLIEAIGEKRFLGLSLHCPTVGKWIASTKTHECYCKKCKKGLKKDPDNYLAINWESAEGSSHKEAVAKLYLELNDNKTTS